MWFPNPRLRRLIPGLRYRFFPLVFLFVLGLSISLGILSSIPNQATATEPTNIAQTTSTEKMQAANAYYEAGQFAQAEALWTELVTAFTAPTGMSLQRVQALSNLSLTQQAQAKWREAQTNIDRALQVFGIMSGATTVQLEGLDGESLRVLAQSLDIRGQLYYLTGQPKAALIDWQQTQQLYQSLPGYRASELKSLLNQAQAYQALGQYLRAESNLKVVEDFWVGADREFKLIALQSLAQTERLLGKLDDAIRHLKQASQLLSPDLAGATQQRQLGQLRLELGNAQYDAAIRNRDRQKNTTTIIGRAQAALDAYQTSVRAAQYAAQSDASSITQLLELQGTLNQLAVRLAFASQFAEVRPDDNPIQIRVLIEAIENCLAKDLPPSRKHLLARIQFADLLAQLAEAKMTPTSTLHTVAQSFDASDLHSQSLAHLQIALVQARTLQDWRVEATATGRLGELYVQVGNLYAQNGAQSALATEHWQAGQSVLEAAIALSTVAHAPDIRYRWHWQTGRLLKQQQNSASALNAYRAAVGDLKQVRNDLLSVDVERQFSFRDDVEPVYREFMELLLTDVDDTTEAGQALINEALENFDELQLAEINNFLGCDSQQVRLESVNDPDSTDPNAVLIYSMILDDKVATIVKPPQSDIFKFHGFKSQRQDNAASDILEEINQLRLVLGKSGESYEVFSRAQHLYEWILEPIEADLQGTTEDNTFVFVLDGALRNIPMSLLHKDNKDSFLIQKHPIALTPRIKLFEPRSLPSATDLSLLLGGLTQPPRETARADANITFNPNFPPIRFLNQELNEIQKIYGNSIRIPSGGFTQENLRHMIKDGNFTAIHFKTHGIFSSDPSLTFIASDTGSINGRDFGNLVQAGSIGDIKTLDLLGLSACQTASGDNRSVLGLTGIAVRSGARSVVSSLWIANDQPNTIFMPTFYAELAKGQSRAQAFRKAQLKLIDPNYFPEPRDWAPYVLVGNWL